MKLSKLKLWNYRCFGSEEQVILIDQLTTFIGNNSAGKTAALSALNCMFSENSNDRILHRSDFHLPKDILPDEMEQQSLYIEAVFEFEELQEAMVENMLYLSFFNTLLLIIQVGCRIYGSVLRPHGKKAILLTARLIAR